MANGINVGDEVQLKSGGPIMTVQEIQDGGRYALCVWFDGNSPKTHVFPVATLARAQ